MRRKMRNRIKVNGVMSTQPLSISGAEDMEGVGGGPDQQESDYGIPPADDKLEERKFGMEEEEEEETATKQKRLLFPFAGVVGQEKMKLGLLLNAINPRIGGMLVQGQKGTAKSVSVRGLAEILPEIDLVKGCRFNCSPHNREKLCWECKGRLAQGEDPLPVFRRTIKVVDLPLGATEDRVVGTMDIEKVMREGKRAFEAGVLADANQGILYVDEINLLDDYVVDVLLDAAAMGVATIEREGVSISHPAEFVIVGTMNPEEGELRPQLLDRLALTSEIKGEKDIELRTQIMINARKFFETPLRFRKEMEIDQNIIRSQVIIGRSLVKRVEMDEKFQRVIAGICIDFNTDGHRSDIIIERTARTNAALRVGQEIVNQVQPYIMDRMEERRRELIETRRIAMSPKEKDEMIKRNLHELAAGGESLDESVMLERAIDLEISFKDLVSDPEILSITKENISRDLDTIVPDVDVDDIVTAAEMVLPHRMRSQPLEEEEFSYDLLLKLVEDKI